MVAAAADGRNIPSDAYKRRRHRETKGEPVFGRVASGRSRFKFSVLSSFSVQLGLFGRAFESVCEAWFVIKRGV